MNGLCERKCNEHIGFLFQNHLSYHGIVCHTLKSIILWYIMSIDFIFVTVNHTVKVLYKTLNLWVYGLLRNKILLMHTLWFNDTIIICHQKYWSPLVQVMAGCLLGHQTITRTNADLFIIRPLGMNINETCMQISNSPFIKMHLKMLPAKGDPFVLASMITWYYCETSNTRRTLVANKIFELSDAIGASPVGAAPTTSSFLT